MIRDILGQAWEALQFNRRRSIITVVGMAWGIATVVLLLAYGAGFGRAFEAIFAQWGTHLMGVVAGKTSEQAGASKAGVTIRFKLDDVDRILDSVPGITVITPMVNKDMTVQNDLHTYTWPINGLRAVGGTVMHLKPETGRFFTELEDQQRAHVAVIGSEAKSKLFGGRWAVGEPIRIGGIRFTVVGVLEPKIQEGDDDVNRNIYIPFNPMGDLMDTYYINGVWFNYEGENEKVERALRTTMAAAHNFKVTDHNAIFVINLMEQLEQFRLLSIGLQVLLTFIGALTLGIAGIGLMNIMLVAVQQRTREIGIEKALGAQKRHILLQFMAEAMAITAAGGLGGILLAYLVSLAAGRITFYSALAKHAEDADIRLIISPMSLLVSVIILAVVGTISGMIPAIRASRLNPIEALRYE